MSLSENRNMITESDYTAHLGSHQGFTQKFAFKLDNLSQLVFIADGAKWIWDWVKNSYGQSLQILDYFHCKEKLCGFALAAFKEERLRKEWVAEQGSRAAGFTLVRPSRNGHG